jgi:hypothetical protein
MGYLLTLQTLDQRDGEHRDQFASTFSTGICVSSTSAGIC